MYYFDMKAVVPMVQTFRVAVHSEADAVTAKELACQEMAEVMAEQSLKAKKEITNDQWSLQALMGLAAVQQGQLLSFGPSNDQTSSNRMMKDYLKIAAPLAADETAWAICQISCVDGSTTGIQINKQWLKFQEPGSIKFCEPFDVASVDRGAKVGKLTFPVNCTWYIPVCVVNLISNGSADIAVDHVYHQEFPTFFVVSKDLLYFHSKA